METNRLTILLRYAAIAGNILFVLWITFNAMDEGFRGTLVQKASGGGLIALLIINCFLLLNKSKKEQYIGQD